MYTLHELYMKDIIVSPLTKNIDTNIEKYRNYIDMLDNSNYALDFIVLLLRGLELDIVGGKLIILWLTSDGFIHINHDKTTNSPTKHVHILDLQATIDAKNTILILNSKGIIWEQFKLPSLSSLKIFVDKFNKIILDIQNPVNML